MARPASKTRRIERDNRAYGKACHRNHLERSPMTYIKKYLPVGLKRWLRAKANGLALAKASFYDYRRFRAHSGVFRRYHDEASLGALITKYYHMIEKGLALPAPRPGFGNQAVHDLSLLVTQAMRNGMCARETALAIDAIAGWRTFNLDNSVPVPVWADALLDNARQAGITVSGSPIKCPADVSQVKGGDHLDFIRSRSSVRNFSSASVPAKVLDYAVQAAQSAPCVCNRQASRIYFFADSARKQAVFACQNGNRGFGDIAPVAALVTVDLREFVEPSERYQGWIDGGMFAMNFLLGLHAQGYGACALNWSALPEQDQRLRKLGIIPEHESVIMMVAVGALKNDLKVARSERLPIAGVLRHK
jgi:nitroreductase